MFMLTQQKTFLHYYHEDGLYAVVKPTAVWAVYENWLLTYNYVDDELLLNMAFYEAAIAGIDRPNGVFRKVNNELPAGSKKDEKGIFLLIQDRRHDNSILHSTPNYIMIDKHHRLFFNYAAALAFAKKLAQGPYRKKEFSIYRLKLNDE